MIQRDEREWENEFADLPAKTDSIASSERSATSLRLPQSRLINLTEFSGYLAEHKTSETSDMSLGNFFSKRCEDLHRMIPNKSPTKQHKPVPLILCDDYSGKLP